MAMDFDNSKIDTAHSEHEQLFQDPRTARKRAREDRRRRRKYKFTDKKHSRSGILATILVLPEIAMLVYAVVSSVQHKGQAGALVGWLPFFSLVLSVFGIILSSAGFHKTDTVYTFSWTGLCASIAVFLFVAVVMVTGL